MKTASIEKCIGLNTHRDTTETFSCSPWHLK